MSAPTLRLSVLALTVASLTIAPVADACTTFVVGEGNHQLFGRTYDWEFGDGYVMVNKRGVSKRAYPSRMPGEGGEPLAWTSRYGSVTFNQYGRDMPQGGMNEAGLIVEMMAVPGMRNPPPDPRPYVPSAALWRQFLLDTAATVKDVIDSDAKVRMSFDASKSVGVHFLVLDRTGDAAAIEFLDGRMVVHRGDSLPVKVLSNDTYRDSLRHWQDKSFPASDPAASIRRFVTAADLVRSAPAGGRAANLKHAHDVMKAVSWAQTRWRIVYDNRGMKIHFNTDAKGNIRTVDASAFDYSCRSPVRVLDVNADLAGDVTTRFIDYTTEINAALVKTSFGKLASRIPVSPQAQEFLAAYPEQSRCAG